MYIKAPIFLKFMPSASLVEIEITSGRLFRKCAFAAINTGVSTMPASNFASVFPVQGAITITSRRALGPIGSASCMAAAAITYIRGGSTKQVFDAGAFALKSLLGLVCDPLGGLVEVPCIKRNVIGSVNAITASDMAMAEIESKVPLDEDIDAMEEVVDILPCSLK